MAKEHLSDFKGICNSHFDEVYGYVAYRLAPDFDAAADVTQEVFLAACKGWTSYSGDGSTLSWLRAIAQRKVADHFRKQPRNKGLGEAPATARCSHEPGMTDAERNALIIGSVMSALPEDYVCLLEDKYLNGLSVRQIAQRRGTTEQAVASALHRARQGFKDKFERTRQNWETKQ